VAIGYEFTDEERAIMVFLNDTLRQPKCPTRFGF
jgi:hypothetical protein